MTKKIKDLAVKTGEYTNRDGEVRGRWKNVGSMMKTDDGGVFLLLDRTFNPAGVPQDDPTRDNVLVSVFDLREQDGEKPAAAAPVASKPSAAAAPASAGDDDIPF